MWYLVLFQEMQTVDGFVEVAAYAGVVTGIALLDVVYEPGQLFFSDFHFEGF